MKVFLRRAQRDAGLLGGKIIFSLDARIEPTPEEADAIRKYKLGGISVYNSESAKKHASGVATNLASGKVWGTAKAAVSAGMMALSLRCTLDSLTKGQHIECKDMEELLGAEAAIIEACNTAKAFLEAAVTFDGREEVIEI
ncbi:MAG: hypothetical protein H6883_02565 [Rhodobiaceae bacterium]|nr:hypothetical protein [Rhodobiaceae bacterium]MCC0055001.1 hypothetical protein [Rhodobiaceae bacterium]